MGSLAGSIFDLIEGNPEQQEENTLGTIGNEQIATGENLVTPAATYYENLLSNNPTAEAQALAPEISAGQNQVQQQADQNAQFGNRGGGTNASTQAAEGQERGNIINLLGEQKAGAASGAASLGSEQENAGTGNITTEANMAVQNQKREANDINGIAQGAASIAMPFLDGDGSGAVDPYETLYNAQNAENYGGLSLQPTGSDINDLIQ